MFNTIQNVIWNITCAIPIRYIIGPFWFFLSEKLVQILFIVMFIIIPTGIIGNSQKQLFEIELYQH